LVLTFLVLPFWYLLTRVDPDIFQTSSKTVVCVLFMHRWIAGLTCMADYMPKLFAYMLTVISPMLQAK